MLFVPFACAFSERSQRFGSGAYCRPRSFSAELAHRRLTNMAETIHSTEAFRLHQDIRIAQAFLAASSIIFISLGIFVFRGVLSEALNPLYGTGLDWNDALILIPGSIPLLVGISLGSCLFRWRFAFLALTLTGLIIGLTISGWLFLGFIVASQM
jgi:hypothetical protein